MLLTVLFLLVAGNSAFWRAALAGRDWGQPSTVGLAAAMFVGFCGFFFAFGALISTRHTVKPLLTVLLLVSAAAAYYIDRYAIYFDPAMLRNVLATDYKEARELLGWGLAQHLLVFGVVPSMLVWWPRLKRRPLGRAVAARLGWIALALALGVGSLLLVFADFASLMRNKKEIRYLLTPGNVVVAAVSNGWGQARHTGKPKLP
ncbi:MAG: DUF1705 domain-containing protein, partial [Ramlibacter sp.]